MRRPRAKSASIGRQGTEKVGGTPAAASVIHAGSRVRAFDHEVRPIRVSETTNDRDSLSGEGTMLIPHHQLKSLFLGTMLCVRMISPARISRAAMWSPGDWCPPKPTHGARGKAAPATTGRLSCRPHPLRMRCSRTPSQFWPQPVASPKTSRHHPSPARTLGS